MCVWCVIEAYNRDFARNVNIAPSEFFENAQGNRIVHRDDGIELVGRHAMDIQQVHHGINALLATQSARHNESLIES